MRKKGVAKRNVSIGNSKVANTKEKNNNINNSCTKYRRKNFLIETAKRYTASSEQCIPRIVFQRLIRSVTEDMGYKIKWQAASLKVLQDAAEMHLTSLFAAAAACCDHADRKTVMIRDFWLVQKLRKNMDMETVSDCQPNRVCGNEGQKDLNLSVGSQMEREALEGGSSSSSNDNFILESETLKRHKDICVFEKKMRKDSSSSIDGLKCKNKTPKRLRKKFSLDY